jgi:protein TonB
MQMAAISPTPSNAPTKRDYGWLSEAILRRVEELKRYPASARVDRAEGKVVVKAMIDEDGSIGEVEVFQSSGHPGLDKAAIETLRQAAPFHLPRPLGQPHMTIKIPMSYRLDR